MSVCACWEKEFECESGKYGAVIMFENTLLCVSTIYAPTNMASYGHMTGFLLPCSPLNEMPGIVIRACNNPWYLQQVLAS